MKRACILMLPLLASIAAWAGPVADQRGSVGPVAISGSYLVTFNVNIASPVPTGATITCRAKLAPNSPSFDRFNRGIVPVQTAAGVAKIIGSGRIGSSASCSVALPFAWVVEDSTNGAALSYEIDEESGSEPAKAVRSPQGIGVPYPESGGTASVRLNVTL